MNKIINKFLLTGDKFMLEFYLKQPRFTYSACGPFTKHRERIQILEKQLSIFVLSKNIDKNKYKSSVI